MVVWRVLVEGKPVAVVEEAVVYLVPQKDLSGSTD